MKNEKIIFAKIIFACNKAVKYIRVVSDTNSETVRKNINLENTIEPKNYHADSNGLDF